MQVTPLERWAARSPAVRWPLVLALVFFLWGLAGWLDATTPLLQP